MGRDFTSSWIDANRKLIYMHSRRPITQLLQRGTRFSGEPDPDVVPLQLSIQRCAADAQHPSGERLVAIDLFENALDRRTLDVL